MDVNVLYQTITNIAGNVVADVAKASITRTFQAAAENDTLRVTLNNKIADLEKQLAAAHDTIKQLSAQVLGDKPPE